MQIYVSFLFFFSGLARSLNDFVERYILHVCIFNSKYVCSVRQTKRNQNSAERMKPDEWNVYSKSREQRKKNDVKWKERKMLNKKNKTREMNTIFVGRNVSANEHWVSSSISNVKWIIEIRVRQTLIIFRTEFSLHWRVQASAHALFSFHLMSTLISFLCCYKCVFVFFFFLQFFSLSFVARDFVIFRSSRVFSHCI